MPKVSTVKFNTIQKFKNMSTQKGKVANIFAKGLMGEGYSNIYQRPFKDDIIALSGTKPTGETKTFLLSYWGFKVKTNKKTPVTTHTAIREIDKANFNEFGEEISGVKKIQKLVSGHIFDSKEVKRGWGA